jgi:CNT family concentrative nucleoside transporter
MDGVGLGRRDESDGVFLANTPALAERSRLLLTYALCGFANFGSLGIMIGGLSTMCPERRGEIIGLGLK